MIVGCGEACLVGDVGHFVAEVGKETSVVVMGHCDADSDELA